MYHLIIDYIQKQKNRRENGLKYMKDVGVNQNIGRIRIILLIGQKENFVKGAGI